MHFLTGFFLLIFIALFFHIWLCIRIGKESVVLAIISFLFAPVGWIYGIVKFSEDGFRIPLLGAILTNAATSYLAYSFVDYSQELENQQIAQADVRANGRPTGSSTNFQASKVIFSADLVDRAYASLHWQTGRIIFDNAHAILDLPTGFRFLPAADVAAMNAAAGVPLRPGMLGWVVHNDIDIRRADGWFVEIRYAPIGRVNESQMEELTNAELIRRARPILSQLSIESASTGGRQFNLLSYFVPPKMDENTHQTVWVEERHYEGDAQIYADGHALKLGQYGVLHFLVEDLPAQRKDIAGAATQIVMDATKLAAGAGYDDVAGDTLEVSPHSVASLITGESAYFLK
jgi:uncharacterized membrane-anchored protein